MKRLISKFVTSVSFLAVAWWVAVRVACVALSGVALTWGTGISWAFVVPVCVAIGMLTLLVEDGFRQASLARRRHDPTT
ncbi:hypothetical protein AB1L30_19315 [Bremerella sp. JC817]|uniref:hypothetical protein n=1 Tax=Bremerella sp. JC817 TaxID=3231756 RepID=UPI0034590FBA